MRVSFLTFLLLFIIYQGLSQDWKGTYDRAVADFQLQHYPAALVGAEKAYTVSKTLETKYQSFSLQLLTAICLEIPDYTKGLAFANEEVKLFGQTEGTKSTRYAEALKKRAQMFQALSQWKEARKDYEELLNLYAESPGTASPLYLVTQSNYGQVLLSLDDFTSAADILNNAIAGLKKNPDEAEEYGLALYYAAYADNKNKNVTAAGKRLQEFILLADNNGWQSMPEYAQAKTQLVQLADDKGNLAEGVALVEQGNRSEDQKARQYLKAAIESQQAHPAEALGYFKLAEESLSKIGMQNNTGFSIFQNYARCLYSNRQIIDAQAKLDKAREIARTLYSVSSVEFGYVLELDADLAMIAGNATTAGEKYDAAFKNFLSLPPATQAAHHVTAAINLLNANRPDLAVKMLEGVVTDYTTLLTLPEEIQLKVSSLYTEILLQLNLTDRAIRHLTAHSNKNATPIAQNTIALKLAEVYQGGGDWKKSEALFESVIKKSNDLPAVQAEAFYQLARLRQQIGKYKEAETNYREAIAASQKLGSLELSQVYNSFATFYMTLGNYSAAESIYQNLLKDPQTSSTIINAVKQNLAAIYQQTLRYDKAELLLKEVLDSDRKIIGEKHPDFAISLQNLAALYQMKGNFEKARELYLRALEVDKLNGGDQTLSYANKAANLGTVYQEIGDTNKALQLLESALKIQERILGKAHPDYMYTIYNLSVLKKGLGEFAAAAPLFRQVSDFYLKQIKEIFPTLSDFEKTAYLNKINKVIDDYEEFVVRYQQNDPVALSQLFNFRLETKALLLNASVKVRNTILASGNADLQTKFGEWLQLKEKLARFVSMTLEEKQGQQRVIEESQQKANQLEKWLSTQSEIFGGEFTKQPVTWLDVKKALKPGEASVEMIRLSLEKDSVIYAALVLRPEQQAPVLMTFGKGRKMEGREFSYYSNSIRFHLENDRSYALYWEPIEVLLRNVTTVYFSADGVYNKINPLTLYDKQKNHYLVDRLTVRLLSNLREIVKPPRTLSGTLSASLFGFPDFRSGTPLPAVNGGALTRNSAISEIVRHGVADLPGTKEEVLNIEKLLKKNQWIVNSYLNKEASEDKIKSIASPDILHIATHGFFISENDGDAPMVYSKDGSLSFDNPLTRSGLLLAGVEKNLTTKSSNPGAALEEDGVLTALEVMNLNLDHTDLVILSACETGSGKIRNGEGVYGLQRAFLVSGANNLVMSLWKVSDEATEELMIGFYTNFLASKDKVAAFRQAQLDLKKKYDAPFYWGAFVLIGR